MCHSGGLLEHPPKYDHLNSFKRHTCNNTHYMKQQVENDHKQWRDCLWVGWRGTHRKVSEDLEGAAQEVNEVHEVAAGPAVWFRHAPFVISELNELIDLLVELGVYLPFSCVSGILKTRNRAIEVIQMCTNTGTTSCQLHLHLHIVI